MGAEYQFVDTWFVPGASPEEVYEAIGDALSYPRWWGKVFVAVTGEDGLPRAGKKNAVTATGFLPYKLHFTTEIVEAEQPKRFRMRLEGDFEGGGEWTFAQEEGGTRAQLDWRPIVNKPLVKHLTPVLRPLFRKNHVWTMDRGQEQITAEVARRRGTAGVTQEP